VRRTYYTRSRGPVQSDFPPIPAIGPKNRLAVDGKFDLGPMARKYAAEEFGPSLLFVGINSEGAIEAAHELADGKYLHRSSDLAKAMAAFFVDYPRQRHDITLVFRRAFNRELHRLHDEDWKRKVAISEKNRAARERREAKDARAARMATKKAGGVA
jgi:hypothetical protein